MTNAEVMVSTDRSQAEPSRIEIPDWSPFIAVWFTIVNTMVLPGNFLTIVAYFKFKTLNTGINILICNQSIMDFLTGLAGHVFIYFNFTSEGVKIISENKHACLLVLGILNFSLLSSVINITALSLERLVAVCFPFASTSPRKKPSILLGVILTWFIITLSCTLPSLGWNLWSQNKRCAAHSVYSPTFVIFFAVTPISGCLIITAVINLIILFTVRKKHTKVQNVQIAGKKSTEPACNKNSSSAKANNSVQRSTNNLPLSVKPKRHQKITLMLLIVVGVFYLCWMPLMMYAIVFLVSPLYFKHDEMIISFEFSKGLIVLNGFFNPFIYATRNKAFRLAFKRLLHINNHH